MVSGPLGDRLVPYGQVAAAGFGGSQDDAAWETFSAGNQEAALLSGPAVAEADG